MQQHLFDTKKIDTYMITLSPSECLFFFRKKKTVSLVFYSVIVFLRLHFTVKQLFDWVFFETFSLTWRANSRPPTKQIHIKPFSNIQMRINIFPPQRIAPGVQCNGTARPMSACNLVRTAHRVKDMTRSMLYESEWNFRGQLNLPWRDRFIDSQSVPCRSFQQW